MGADQTKYLSFLLRLWRMEQNEHCTWRASLEDTHTGERRGFANLEALVEFLHELIRKREEADLIVRK